MVLLWFAFLTQGAKSSSSFFALSALFLLFSLILRQRTAAFRPLQAYWKELGLCICLLGSQFFSKDPSVTLYYTFQALMIVYVWLFLKSRTIRLPNLSIFMTHLAVMGAISLIATLTQFVRGHWLQTYGVFPINPIFNAAWMACVGCALVAYLQGDAERGRRRLVLWILA